MMGDPTPTYSTKHPHEPEIPPALDEEGRCLVCALIVHAEDLETELREVQERLWAQERAMREQVVAAKAAFLQILNTMEEGFGSLALIEEPSTEVPSVAAELQAARERADREAAYLEDALRDMLDLVERHPGWCGYKADAPGDGIINWAPRNARAVLAAEEPSEPVHGFSDTTNEPSA